MCTGVDLELLLLLPVGGLCDENEVPVCRGQDFHTEAS